MSPKDAYEALVGNEVDYVPLDQVKGRVSATLALIYPPGIGVVVPGERWDERAQPMLDYFLAFEESFNRFPGFNYEVQGVYQEKVDGRIRFHTYVVRECTRTTTTRRHRHGRTTEEDERHAADVHRHGEHDGLGHHHAARQHGQVGAISLLSWIVTALGSLAIAYGFAQAGIFNQRTGGLAAYAEDAYGKDGYFQVFFLYFLSLAIANVAVASSALGYLAAVLPGADVDAGGHLHQRDRAAVDHHGGQLRRPEPDRQDRLRSPCGA